MNRLFITTLMLVFALAPALAQPTIKKIKITDLEQIIAQSDHPLIVNFWATFCTPCIKEIPYFQSTIAQYKEVELILVSLDGPAYYPARIAAFAQSHDFTAPILWLDENNAGVCARIDPRWTGG